MKLGTIQDVVRGTEINKPVFSYSRKTEITLWKRSSRYSPFGPITDENKKISWPPEHEIIMSLVGFEEAYLVKMPVTSSDSL